MSLRGLKVLIVESDLTHLSDWRAGLQAAGATVEHKERAGNGLEALLVASVTAAPHDLVLLGPSVTRPMQQAFGHTLVGALKSCRLAFIYADGDASAPPIPHMHGASIAFAAPQAAVRVARLALGHEDEHTGPGAEPCNTDQYSILIVEDNPVNREVAELALRQAGMTVESVHDGQQALDAVGAKSYDGIVMDIQMPVMDGLTATLKIRELPPPVGRTPIIAMTANVLPIYRQRAAEVGMNRFVEKPIKASILVDAIQSAIAEYLATMPETTTAEADPEVLDIATLRALQTTFGAALARVHATLARDAPKRLTQMNAAARSRDFDKIRREAHSLKSSSATFGLTRVARLSREIETACFERRSDDALSAVEALTQILPLDLDTLESQMS